MAENGDLCPCHKANSRTFSWSTDILNGIKLVTPALPVSTMGWHFWVRAEAEEPPAWKLLHFPEGSSRRGRTRPVSAASSSLPLNAHTHCSVLTQEIELFHSYFPPKVNFSQCLLWSQASPWQCLWLLTGQWHVKVQRGTWVLLFITNHKGEEKKVIKYTPKKSMEGMCFTLNKTFLASCAPRRHEPGSSSLRLKTTCFSKLHRDNKEKFICFKN